MAITETAPGAAPESLSTPRAARPWPYGTLERARRLAPGLALAIVVAIAAGALAARYEAPPMLLALLLGVALSFVLEEGATRPGLEFAAATVLKGAIAVLGVTIPVQAFVDIGPSLLLSTVAMSFGVILLGVFVGDRLNWPRETSLIASGAVAICGAAAALSLATVISSDRHPRARTTAIIVCVTVLSSISAALQPMAFQALGFSDDRAGFVIGASIHDVAQAVGAGYSISDDAGQTAALTKMVRVSLLPLVLLFAIAVLGSERAAVGKVQPPWFVVTFSVGVLIASMTPLPDMAAAGVQDASRSAFLVAMAAIGLLSKGREGLNVGSSTLGFLAFLSITLLAAAIGAAWMFDR